MPFEHPLRPYTRDDIQSLRPDQTGVYGIFQGNTAIYIGSGDIRDRMLAHFDGDNPCIPRSDPNQWTASVLPGDPTGREGELIQEFQPICSQRSPR